mmetsp:Transcript_110739/g.292428  ORF Transcript_110739/g.292428 Transcript_110739/m.292428 type:complete len:279 (-) Transcript_110739:90-926(-)
MWMWMSIVINGAILSFVIILVFVWALNHYVGLFNAIDIANAINNEAKDANDPDSLSYKLQQAQTVAFISLVWAENVRAYVSRSFDKPVWVGLLDNRKMQYSILSAQIALYCAIFIPYVSDAILGLRGAAIGWEGWVAAFFGALGCLVLCEVFKLLTGKQKQMFDESERIRCEEEEKKRAMMTDAEAKKDAPMTSVAPAPAPAAPAAAAAEPPAQEIGRSSDKEASQPAAAQDNGQLPELQTNGRRSASGGDRRCGAAGSCMPGSSGDQGGNCMGGVLR